MVLTTKEDNRIKFYWDNGVYLGYAYPEIDGDYAFVFTGKGGGCWSDYSLRAIADKLTELNKPFRDELEKYFKNEQNKTKIS